MSGRFDVAQICENGHVVNYRSRSFPQGNKKFCDKCGAVTLSHCPSCSNSIRGTYLSDMIGFSTDYQRPAYCAHCGEPFPWTAATLTAIQELAAEIDELTDEDREELEASAGELLKGTPATPFAEHRLKRLMSKISPAAASLFKDLLLDALAEAAVKGIFG